MLATWLQRVGAMLIDQAVAGLIPVLLVIFALATRETQTNMFGQTASTLSPAGALAISASSIVYGIVNFANRVVLAGSSGQSLGKRVLDIRLESAADGMVVGVGSAFAREVVHVLDQFMFLGYLRPLWDPERRTFADGLMRTRVVNSSLRWV